MRNATAKIIIVTGPTGGHFFPGLALAENLTEKYNCTVFFVLPARQNWSAWLQKKRLPYAFLPEVKFSWRRIYLFFPRFFYIFILSLLLLLREKPDVVVGTGSYACVPFILAARLLSRKIILHEQNLLPGRATCFLAPFAATIALSFPYAGYLPWRKCKITGFPILKEFLALYPREKTLKEFGLDVNKPTVLVVGGSQSSRYLNNIIENNLAYLQQKNIQFLHCAGPDKNRLEFVYQQYQVPAAVFDFFSEMGKIYSVCDLAICRAGAGTLAEITARKIPALLVPYPFAGKHQFRNAEFLARQDICLVMEQNSKNLKQFPLYFEELLKKAGDFQKNMARFSLADTRGCLADLVLEAIQ